MIEKSCGSYFIKFLSKSVICSKYYIHTVKSWVTLLMSVIRNMVTGEFFPPGWRWSGWGLAAPRHCPAATPPRSASLCGAKTTFGIVFIQWSFSWPLIKYASLAPSPAASWWRSETTFGIVFNPVKLQSALATPLPLVPLHFCRAKTTFVIVFIQWIFTCSICSRESSS